jgi:FkbM family methyltransferase
MKLNSLIGYLVPQSLKAARHRRRLRDYLEGHARASAICAHEGAVFFANPRNKIEKMLLRGDYDRVNNALIRNFVHPGNVCFDVGANIGVYSAVLARAVGPEGHVHAFEPVPHIRQKLQRNLGLNGFDWVTVNDVGLGDTNAELPMHQVKEGTFRAGTSSFVRNTTIQEMGDELFQVRPAQIITMDDYVQRNNIKRLNFIKIDVEGFELNVLLGGKETLSNLKPKIIMEFDMDRHGDKSSAFKDLFADLRYDVYECIPFGREIVLEPFGFAAQPRERNLLCLPSH